MAEMFDKRKEAFRQWSKGVITDDNLVRVVDDLETAMEVFRAIGDNGVIVSGLLNIYSPARLMLENRKYEAKRKHKE